jgi:hypothetical protein
MLPNLQDLSTLTQLCPDMTFQWMQVNGFNVAYANDVAQLKAHIMPVHIFLLRASCVLGGNSFFSRTEACVWQEFGAATGGVFRVLLRRFPAGH